MTAPSPAIAAMTSAGRSPMRQCTVNCLPQVVSHRVACWIQWSAFTLQKLFHTVLMETLIKIQMGLVFGGATFVSPAANAKIGSKLF